eukprot:UN17643
MSESPEVCSFRIGIQISELGSALALYNCDILSTAYVKFHQNLGLH